MLRIALVAHNNCKSAIAELAEDFRDFLSRCEVCATGTTGALIEARSGLILEKLMSGPLGGDMQIGARIATGELDALIFLRDPMTAHPHEPDIGALVRACDVHDIPYATNRSGARMLLMQLQSDWQASAEAMLPLSLMGGKAAARLSA